MVESQPRVGVGSALGFDFPVNRCGVDISAKGVPLPRGPVGGRDAAGVRRLRPATCVSLGRGRGRPRGAACPVAFAPPVSFIIPLREPRESDSLRRLPLALPPSGDDDLERG